jgi:hypothetical protein
MILIGIVALAPWWIQPGEHAHGANIGSHALQNTVNASVRTSRII